MLDGLEREPAGGSQAGEGEALPIYSCFDFQIRSDIALPELVRAAEDDRRPLVTVRTAPGATTVEAPGGLELMPAGAALLSIPAVGRFTVTGDSDILVEPAPGVSARNIRLFLLGSALGILCHRRGLLPLHANGVVVDGRVHAFAGQSGAGKSTLAAQFARFGLPVLSDDVVAVGPGANGRPCAWPGVARLKLWSDASAAMGHDVSRLDRALDDTDKYHVPLAHQLPPAPLPFARLYLLERAAEGEAGSIVRLRGGDALSAVIAHTYRGGALATLGLTADHFRRCAALVGRIDVYVATRAWGFDRFAEEAQRLLDHAAGSGSEAP